MITLESNMHAVVVGLGKSGLATVRYLHQQGLEVAVSEYGKRISTDEQAVLDRCGVRLETGGHTQAFFADADLIVVSPGVPADLEVLVAARDRRIPVIGELALAAGRIPVPVIAVTGSNGKTTVTGLIGHLLRSAGKKVFVGGNIGTPVLEYLMEPGEAEAAVLELSSFQLEAAGSFRPDIALLLNLSPDHIDRHGGFEDYVAAKMNLFVHQGGGDTSIIGLDDPLIAAAPPTASENLYGFGMRFDCRARVDGRIVRLRPDFGSERREGQTELYDLTATRLSSSVNLYNAAAAVLAARAFGCDEASVRAGLADYQPPRHRMTPVGEIDGVQFINDSKATNVGAVVAALAGFGQGTEKKVVLIAGGRNKGGDFSALVPSFRQYAKHVVLIGESASDLAAVAEDAGVGYQFAADMEEAVAASFVAAAQGDTVLLAPACASFDMFRSYEHRGEVFGRCVGELAE